MGKTGGVESKRGFYGIEDDLSALLRTLLMCGHDDDDRIDIPMFRITGLPKDVGSVWLSDKIKVGAHYFDFKETKGGVREAK